MLELSEQKKEVFYMRAMEQAGPENAARAA
jgi:hypothetical protein